jgi:hypothetical protein
MTDDGVLSELHIARLAADRELACGYREAARRALAFARRYREEEGAAGGARELACIAQAQRWRSASRALQATRSASLAVVERPGLARARVEASDDAEASGGRRVG